MAPKAIFDVLTADVRTLQRLLGRGAVNNSSLVDRYLAQIEKHDDYLHALIQVTPRDLLVKRAGELDGERKEGRLRGPLHGIPIIIKVRPRL